MLIYNLNMKLFLFILIGLLIIGICVRIFNGYHAYRIYLDQKENTDFSKAEAFTYTAKPERKKALLIHGITGSTNEMRGLALYLQKYGISSYCPKLIGHGTSFYDAENYRMKDWSKQIRTEAAKDKYDYVIGLCAGSNFAIDLAAEHKYEKIVLLSPIFRYPPKFLGLTCTFLIPLIHPFYRYYPKRPIHYENIIAYNVLPTINAWDLYLYNFQTLKKLPKINTKTLVIFAGKDDLYEQKLPAYLAKNIRNSQVAIIPGSQHVITMDENRQKCFEKIRDFLLTK